MKTVSSFSYLVTSLKLTAIMLIVFGVAYPLVISAIAYLTPDRGKGDLDLIGQSFTSDKYFNSRPSAVNYNAASAGGSNMGPTDAGYLAQVRQRIDDFLRRNLTVKREEIPVDLVTASGSGLDPHISLQAAKVQVDRIARVRGISKGTIDDLIRESTEMSLLGPVRLNVLKLNKALDNVKKTGS